MPTGWETVNVVFGMLNLYAGALGHTKYKLWLWRYIAYIVAILSPKESFEYKWNICQNLMGGVDQNIPNDNCVELQIKKIKSQLNTQGSNKSFNSAKVVTMSTQVIDNMKQKLMQVNNTVRAGRKRPQVDKSVDIGRIAECVLKNGHGVVKDWPSFSKFKDPLSMSEMLTLVLFHLDSLVCLCIYMSICFVLHTISILQNLLHCSILLSIM